MNKLKLRIIILCFTLFTLVLSTLFIFYSEQSKQLAKYQAKINKYEDMLSTWAKYRDQYLTQVNLIKEENKKNMELAKQNYDKLFAQQPDLILQHTTTTPYTTTPVAPIELIGNVTTTTTTPKQVVKVTKPKSTPTTSAS